MDQDATQWKTLFTSANQLFRATKHPLAVQLPVEGSLPSLADATQWLNSPPLTTADLRGKVVLVDFWTYTCINWLRTLPYLRAWADKYQDHGLVVIGVHTPEFDVEHDLDNVRRAVKNLRVDYPVAIDNDYAIWSAFNNHYWPALYVADAQGKIRHHQFGEGGYEQSEMILQQLLTAAGVNGIGQSWSRLMPVGLKLPPTGPACGPRKLPRLCAHRELRVSRWCGLGYAASLCCPGAVCALPMRSWRWP
jgi:thiol-disulfide isomerase/thioredoxin